MKTTYKNLKYFVLWKTTYICLEMEDDLKKIVISKQPQQILYRKATSIFFLNERQPQNKLKIVDELNCQAQPPASRQGRQPQIKLP